MNAVTLMQTPTGWYATPMGPWASTGTKSGEKFAHSATPDATALAVIAAELPRDVLIVIEGVDYTTYKGIFNA
jgi:hypothetical protein